MTEETNAMSPNEPDQMQSDDSSLLEYLVLDEAPDITVARVVLGLTMYLDEPLRWAQKGAALALSSFLKRAPVDRLQWYTTSLLSDWHPVGPDGHQKLVESICSWSLSRPRHLLWFRLVDDTGAPSVEFSYREMDPAFQRRCSTLQMALPDTSDPAQLVSLAMEIADHGRFLCGTGGYAVRWNEHEKSTALWEAYDWSRRYLGLDIQDLDEMAWHAGEGLPGTGWLTLLGDRFAEQLEIEGAKLFGNPSAGGVKRLPVRDGWVVQAGSAPTLGDVNRLGYPKAYAEVACRLAPYFIQDVPEYLGGFLENEATSKWLRRFVEPEGWS